MSAPGRHLCGTVECLAGTGLDYAGLTAVMDMVFGVWDHLEGAGKMSDEAGDMFEAIIGHLGHLREFTGWGGVPGKYLR